MVNQRMAEGLTIYNFQLDVGELMSYFASHDNLYFFCPKYSRTAVETAVQITLEDMTDYNPLKVGRNLMTILMDDIEVYYAKNPHPSLMDSKFLEQLEIITGQIEEYTNFFVRNRLPMNQQCHIFWPKWCGNTLTFALRIY